jgi:hypothetical protein
MTKPRSPYRECEVCGGTIRQNNLIGICRRTPECIRLRGERIRRNRGVQPRGSQRPNCSVPDCPNPSRRHGLCEMHGERAKRNGGDPGPAGLLIRPRVIQAGDKFGRWTTVEGYSRGANERIMCHCECGTERLVAVHSLLKGLSKSCGCAWRYKDRQKRAAEPYARAGDVFNRLTLLDNVAYSTDRVRCRCECGSEASIVAVMVKLGYTQSCGCLRRESWQTHGLSNHPLYKTWAGMIRRCTVPNEAAYAYYGARGIKVCERWLGAPEGLLNFIADMGPRPSAGHSIERRNVDGDYEPANCKWATSKEQADNRRTVTGLTQERDEALAQVRELQEALAAARGTLF